MPTLPPGASRNSKLGKATRLHFEKGSVEKAPQCQNPTFWQLTSKDATRLVPLKRVNVIVIPEDPKNRHPVHKGGNDINVFRYGFTLPFLKVEESPLNGHVDLPFPPDENGNVKLIRHRIKKVYVPKPIKLYPILPIG